MKKFKFKIGQTVAFVPEEGVILTGKIVSCHAFINGFKKGGEPRPKRCAYNVEESDGSIWNCEEHELVQVMEIK